MAGEHGRNRDLDFAYWANLGGKKNFTDKEIQGLVSMLGYSPLERGINEQEAKRAALIQSESLYRVSCLLAYGHGADNGNLASLRDVSEFTWTNVESERAYDPDFPDDTSWRISAVLPYCEWYDDASLPSVIRTPPKNNDILNPSKAFFKARRDVNKDEGFQVYTLAYLPVASVPKSIGDVMRIAREPYKTIGQVIANAYTFTNYVGVYDGKPAFATRTDLEFSSLWQVLVELTEKQAPGICPVCGRVIDRRRGKSGGKPRNTCAAHSDKLQNMKKKLQAEKLDASNRENARREREGLSSVGNFGRNSVDIEEAVRLLRWHDASLNERPLRFPGKAVAMRR